MEDQPSVRFKILGMVEVWLGSRQIEVGAAKLRAVLAVLLLRANETVSIDDLIEQIWSGSPPEAARTTVQAYVYRLRRLVQELGSNILQTKGAGYLLTVPPEALDLHQFDTLVIEGRRSIREGLLDEGSSLLRAALALWRGPALASVPVGALTASIRGLEDYRLVVTEEYLWAQLTMGRHSSVMPELLAAASNHIYSEKLHAWLMLALYRSGRRAEALSAYSRIRATLVADLGIEPGAELQRLHQAILAGEPPLELPPVVLARKGNDEAQRPADREPAAVAVTQRSESAWRPVFELPSDITRFVGRDGELATVRRLLTQQGPAASVCVMTGTCGVGKSALAIHTAHTLAPHFPDGMLYVDLNGSRSGREPLAPEQVLWRWLRTMGVNGADLPENLGAAAAQFRSMTAGRRMIVLLDNAHNVAQVTPLLPATATAAVLVTGRRKNLNTLDNASEVRLVVMNPDEALELLSGLVGATRVRDEPTVAAAVVRRCGYLPLAIRVAAARISSRPDRPISAFARLLASESDRLNELHFGDLDVRACIRSSYDDLLEGPTGAHAAHIFRMLGLLRGSEVSLPQAAALAGWSAEVTDMALEHLVDTNLLQCVGASYRIPDLIRLFAREQMLTQGSVVDRHAAQNRLHRLKS